MIYVAPQDRKSRSYKNEKHTPSLRHSAWDYDEEEDDDDDLSDSVYDEPVEPREGHVFSDADILSLRTRSVAARFMNSRVLRFRVSMDDIVGVRLQTMQPSGAEEGECDRASVLVMEVCKPPPSKNAFCARKIHSK